MLEFEFVHSKKDTSVGPHCISLQKSNNVSSISACSLNNYRAIFDFLYAVTHPQKSSVPDHMLSGFIPGSNTSHQVLLFTGFFVCVCVF